MNSRKEIIRKVKRLEIVSLVFLVLGTLVCIFYKPPYFVLISIVGLYLAVMFYSYYLLSKGKCENCGCVDIYTKQYTFTSGVKSHCPKCNQKIKDTIKLKK